MKENKQNIFEKNLAELPQYEPDESVWLEIKSRLPLVELNSYSPPASVWDNIENQVLNEDLDATKNPKQVPSIKILKGSLKWYWAAAAITVIGILSITFLFNDNKNTDNSLVITTETLDNQLNVINFDDANKDFALIETFCKTAQPVCLQPDFKALKEELNTINNAQQRLKNTISSYNSDPGLVEQLTDLENKRSVILKKMMEKI